MLHLVYLEDHVKNYRPSILIYSGNPVARPCLIDFFANITKDISLLICGDVIVATSSMIVTDSSLRKRSRKIQYWLRKRKIKAFFNPVVAPTYQFGCKALLQLAGLGNLKPNIAAFGFKRNWKQCSIKDVEEYFSLIQERKFNYDLRLAGQHQLKYSSRNFVCSLRVTPAGNKISQHQPAPTDEV
uniref:SLC12A transporter C-terminal domain-containing protein n=1 Tax=Romanomermis culicivorax TaxID=13658 RepID=A0A915HTJ8_ROMCU